MLGTCAAFGFWIGLVGAGDLSAISPAARSRRTTRPARASPIRSLLSTTWLWRRAEHDRPAPRPSRLKWLLIASLGLNLALVGVIAGAVIKGPHGPPAIGLWNYGRALPEPYRHDLGAALRASRHDWIGPREALRGQRAALADRAGRRSLRPGRRGRGAGREPRLSDELAARGSRLLLEQIRAWDRKTAPPMPRRCAANGAARRPRSEAQAAWAKKLTRFRPESLE